MTIEATGSFEALESSDVAPESSGRVVAAPVEVGQFVRQGSVLVRIEGVNAGLRLDEARAAATRAEANVKLALGEPARTLYDAAEKDENCKGKDFSVVYRFLGGKE